jgi:hypothetical protein
MRQATVMKNLRTGHLVLITKEGYFEYAFDSDVDGRQLDFAFELVMKYGKGTYDFNFNDFIYYSMGLYTKTILICNFPDNQ